MYVYAWKRKRHLAQCFWLRQRYKAQIFWFLALYRRLPVRVTTSVNTCPGKTCLPGARFHHEHVSVTFPEWFGCVLSNVGKRFVSGLNDGSLWCSEWKLHLVITLVTTMWLLSMPDEGVSYFSERSELFYKYHYRRKWQKGISSLFFMEYSCVHYTIVASLNCFWFDGVKRKRVI